MKKLTWPRLLCVARMRSWAGNKLRVFAGNQQPVNLELGSGPGFRTWLLVDGSESFCHSDPTTEWTVPAFFFTKVSGPSRLTWLYLNDWVHFFFFFFFFFVSWVTQLFSSFDDLRPDQTTLVCTFSDTLAKLHTTQVCGRRNCQSIEVANTCTACKPSSQFVTVSAVLPRWITGNFHASWFQVACKRCCASGSGADWVSSRFLQSELWTLTFSHSLAPPPPPPLPSLSLCQSVCLSVSLPVHHGWSHQSV